MQQGNEFSLLVSLRKMLVYLLASLDLPCRQNKSGVSEGNDKMSLGWDG